MEDSYSRHRRSFLLKTEPPSPAPSFFSIIRSLFLSIGAFYSRKFTISKVEAFYSRQYRGLTLLTVSSYANATVRKTCSFHVMYPPHTHTHKHTHTHTHEAMSLITDFWHSRVKQRQTVMTPGQNKQNKQTNLRMYVCRS